MKIGLWLDGSMGCDKINRGEMDIEIEALVKYLSSCKASQVFLRIGYGKCINKSEWIEI